MTIVIIGGVATDIVVTAAAQPAIGTCRRASALSEGFRRAIAGTTWWHFPTTRLVP